VATPTTLHKTIGISLADAGIHALIEKPLAGTTADAEELTNVFNEKNLIGAVGHIERYNPAIQELKSRLDGGQLGEVYQIITQRQGPFPSRIGDVGVINDLASHDVDITRFISSSEYSFVMASTAFRSGRDHEDLVSTVGKLVNGVVVSHNVNWLSPLKERQVMVMGSKGAFLASTLTGDLTFYENSDALNDWEALVNFRGVSEGNVIRYAISKHEPLRNELTSFIDSIVSGDKRDIVSFASGLETVRTCEAILQSSKKEEIVKL
jgi:predicted dehydrogenase